MPKPFYFQATFKNHLFSFYWLPTSVITSTSLFPDSMALSKCFNNNNNNNNDGFVLDDRPEQ